jgi:hypothetical protein
MDAINSESTDNIEKIGGDNVGDDGAIEPCPNCFVLKAVSATIRYVSKFACKIVALLGSLIRPICKDKARSMKNTFFD